MGGLTQAEIAYRLGLSRASVNMVVAWLRAFFQRRNAYGSEDTVSCL